MDAYGTMGSALSPNALEKFGFNYRNNFDAIHNKNLASFQGITYKII